MRFTQSKLIATLLTIIFIKSTFAAIREKCDKSCDFKITNIAIQRYYPQILSKDSSYMIGMDYDNEYVLVINIQNGQNKTLTVAQFSFMDCSPILNECIVNSFNSQYTPQRLDLTMNYEDIKLQNITYPSKYSDGPSPMIVSISAKYSLLVSNQILAIYDKQTLTIKVQQDAPSTQFSINTDGSNLINFYDLLENCLYRFNEETNTLQPTNFDCTDGLEFTQKHITTNLDYYLFYSKDTLQMENYTLLYDIKSISINQNYGVSYADEYNNYEISKINVSRGSTYLLKNVTNQDDCINTSDRTFDASIRVLGKYIVVTAEPQDKRDRSVCFYQIKESSQSFPIWAIILIVVLGVLLIGGIIGFYCYKKKKNMNRSGKEQQERNERYDKLKEEHVDG